MNYIEIMEDTHTPKIPISVGELVDKITILEIKNDQIQDPIKKKNVQQELYALNVIYKNMQLESKYPTIKEHAEKLKELNTRLWHWEERVRNRDKLGAFNQEFISLAKSIYNTNDLRYQVKREINLLTQSKLVEEKSYT